jgi:MoxR-like ATPase
MRVEIGYPNAKSERELLAGSDRREMLDAVNPCLTLEQLITIQKEVETTFVSDALLDYCQALLEFSRTSPRFHHGLSPRAGLALLRNAQAWAVLEERDSVLPEDIQAVLTATVSHRLHSTSDTGVNEGEQLAQHLLESVPIP